MKTFPAASSAQQMTHARAHPKYLWPLVGLLLLLSVASISIPGVFIFLLFVTGKNYTLNKTFSVEGKKSKIKGKTESEIVGICAQNWKELRPISISHLGRWKPLVVIIVFAKNYSLTTAKKIFRTHCSCILGRVGLLLSHMFATLGLFFTDVKALYIRSDTWSRFAADPLCSAVYFHQCNCFRGPDSTCVYATIQATGLHGCSVHRLSRLDLLVRRSVGRCSPPPQGASRRAASCVQSEFTRRPPAVQYRRLFTALTGEAASVRGGGLLCTKMSAGRPAAAAAGSCKLDHAWSRPTGLLPQLWSLATPPRLISRAMHANSVPPAYMFLRRRGSLCLRSLRRRLRLSRRLEHSPLLKVPWTTESTTVCTPVRVKMAAVDWRTMCCEQLSTSAEYCGPVRRRLDR